MENDEHLVVRTARKSWKCVNCADNIEPGTQYLEYLGESALYQSGSRYCQICAENVWHVDAANFTNPRET